MDKLNVSHEQATQRIRIVEKKIRLNHHFIIGLVAKEQWKELFQFVTYKKHDTLSILKEVYDLSQYSANFRKNAREVTTYLSNENINYDKVALDALPDITASFNKEINDVVGRGIGLWIKVMNALYQSINNKKPSLEFGAHPLKEFDTFKDKGATLLYRVGKEFHNQSRCLYTLILQENYQYSDVMNIAYWVGSSIQELAEFNAKINSGIDLLLENGKNSKAELLGKLSMKIHLKVREILGVTSGYLLSLFNDSGLPIVSTLNKFQSRIHEIPFYKELNPDGKNVDIHKLKSVIDGSKLIETGGFVREIKAFRTSKGLLMSRIELYDPSSKQSANILIPSIHAEHLGISKRSYLVVHGYVVLEDDGTVTVNASKMSLVELSAQS